MAAAVVDEQAGPSCRGVNKVDEHSAVDLASSIRGAPNLYVLRHGEASHNVARRNCEHGDSSWMEIQDPELTGAT